MVIPHLHFSGNCKDAIALYEKAFCTKAASIITGSDFGSTEPDAENRIAHAVMYIHGQEIFLNDRFGKKDKSTDIAVNLIVTFDSQEELLKCFEIMKEGCVIVDPLETLSYTPLAVQFIDKFGVQWGFMVAQDE